MADTQVRFDFPTAASPSASFMPSINPQFPDHTERKMAIATDKSAGNQRYDYYKGYSERFFTLSFKLLTSTDRSNFESFVADALGKDFQFTDFQGAIHNVRFTAGEFHWTFVFDQSLRFSWTVQLREAV